MLPHTTALMNLSEFGDTALSPNKALSNITVMMVDDEPMMTDVVQTYLEEAGYTQFVAVHDPCLAVEIAHQHPPGLILLDLMMPGLSGFDVLQLIRMDERLRYVPVIVLTAASDPSSKLRALEMGATEFLSKPVDASELKIRVRNSLAFKLYQDRLANDDSLTGLPNRRVFVEELHAALVRCRVHGHAAALFHVNLDRFRQFNDTLGHGAGDMLLEGVAERLRSVARVLRRMPGQTQSSGLFLSRLGGDEFALLLPVMDSPDVASRIARQILRTLKAPFPVNGQDVVMTASIGIAVFPEDGPDDAAMLRNAGVALQHVKSAGRNHFEFYSDKINNVSSERLRLENELRGAVGRNELVLCYQPKVDLRTGRIVGAEALLRWQHPTLGMVSPAKFIPIAEESGLIVEIGEWVVRRACAQMAQWRLDEGLAVRVAVNVSRHSVMSDSLHSLIQSTLTRLRLPPKQLVLELTESMLMDAGETEARLRALRDLGVELSIDDFGTGYSSMSYLKRFPIQELKIDRSFIIGTPSDRTDSAIVRALVVLGHSLGMRVVAEGVETEIQREALRSLHCDLFQGYLCSPALPAKAFIEKLRQVNGTASPAVATAASAQAAAQSVVMSNLSPTASVAVRRSQVPARQLGEHLTQPGRLTQPSRLTQPGGLSEPSGGTASRPAPLWRPTSPSPLRS